MYTMAALVSTASALHFMVLKFKLSSEERYKDKNRSCTAQIVNGMFFAFITQVKPVDKKFFEKS